MEECKAEELLEELQRIVKNVLEYYGERSEELINEENNSDVIRMLQIIEESLKHGFKGNINSILTTITPTTLPALSLFNKKTPGFFSSSLWDFLECLQSSLPGTSEFLVTIKQYSKTPTGRSRIFIRLALNDKSFSEYISALCWNTSLLKKFYKDNALLCQPKLTEQFISLINALQTPQFTFALFVKEPKLDLPEYYSLYPAPIMNIVETKEASNLSDEQKPELIVRESPPLPQQSINQPESYKNYLRLLTSFHDKIQHIHREDPGDGHKLSESEELEVFVENMMTLGLKCKLNECKLDKLWEVFGVLSQLTPDLGIEALSKFAQYPLEQKIKYFIYFTFNQCKLPKMIHLFISDQNMLKDFYSETALLMYNELVSILASNLDLLQNKKFLFPYTGEPITNTTTTTSKTYTKEPKILQPYLERSLSEPTEIKYQNHTYVVPVVRFNLNKLKQEITLSPPSTNGSINNHFESHHEDEIPIVTDDTTQFSSPESDSNSEMSFETPVIKVSSPTITQKHHIRVEETCYQCKKTTTSGYIFSSLRYCYYTNQYYCTDCHDNDMIEIPGYVIMHWDFKPKPVSIKAFKIIKRNWNKPTCNIKKLNDTLYTHCYDLTTVKKLRRRLKKMKSFIRSCRDGRAYVEELKQESREYFLDEHAYILSMRDLVEIKNGKLVAWLKKFEDKVRVHIEEECTRCKAKGWLCELCKNEEELFRWSHGKTQCEGCEALYHTQCWMGKENCPKCKRIEIFRSNDKIRS